MVGLEKANLAEYVEIQRRPGKYMLINFLGGITRGLGIAVGYVIVAALFLSFLLYLTKFNLPLIGNYVADLAQIVKHKLY